MSEPLTDIQLVQKNWDRYAYARDRGHKDFIEVARLNEDYYLGGGLQWSDKDRAYLESLNRPAQEDNQIFPAVNTAIGLQLQSRADIAFKPRGSQADEATAEVLTKVTMQICDDIKYSWLESQIFADGMIMQRGFLDFRIEFDENMQGNIVCHELDPMDVLIDPDAQSYDPEGWQDVIVMRWMTVDDIEELYGADKAREVERVIDTTTGTYESDEDYSERSRFGEELDVALSGGYDLEDEVKRILVVDRQYKKLEMQKVVILPSGQIIAADLVTKDQIAAIQGQGGCCSRRMTRRIRWTVTTADIVLHDEWSPYTTYTIIPYFPYFRRGRTRGMVDNARSPQELHNKSISQFLHILNTSANSGWRVEQGSITNMAVSDLENVGAKTGLVIEFKEGATPPEKIQPNQMPQGLDRLIDRTEMAIKQVTGMSDAMQGLNGPEVAGIAIQSKQYMGQTQLGGPLDNLARTRHLVAMKLLALIQGFYTEERLLMITDNSDLTQTKYEPLVINQQTPEGLVINDLTIGEFDVVVTDMPTQATFSDNQFAQAMEMREKGIAIPDPAVIEMSSLTKKHEIAKSMQEAAAPPPDPLTEAKVEETLAKTEQLKQQTIKTKQESVNTAVDAQYSAMQAAGVIAATPATAPMADQLLRSAGYEDQDAPPIVPSYTGQTTLAGGYPPNYDPTTPVPAPSPSPLSAGESALPLPASPTAGVNAGIETQRNEVKEYAKTRGNSPANLSKGDKK